MGWDDLYVRALAFRPGEIAGFAGAALIIAAYAMKTIGPLRLCAVCSNVLMLVYAVLEGLGPVLLLHCTLLPMNLWRLAALRRAALDRGRAPR